MKIAKELIDIAEDIKTAEFGFTDNWIDEATTVLCHQERELELSEKRILDAFDSGRLFERTQEKNLTDAEIWSISAMYGDLSWRDFTLDFARAILRKASEK